MYPVWDYTGLIKNGFGLHRLNNYTLGLHRLNNYTLGLHRLNNYTLGLHWYYLKKNSAPGEDYINNKMIQNMVQEPYLNLKPETRFLTEKIN